MKQLWKFVVAKLKNEPVLLVAFIAIVTQAGQRALSEGHFTFTLWMTYLFQMVMATVARELVVPGGKFAEVEGHRDKLGEDLNRLLQKSYEESDISKENGSSL